MAAEDGADHRPNCYVEGDRVVYRASSLGGCVRALAACRQGYSAVAPDEKAQRRMAEGVLHEPVILSALERDHGWRIGRRQEELELSVGGRLVVRCHPDGVAEGGTLEPGGRVVEVKAMGRDPYARWLAEGWASYRRYAYQMSVEMFVTMTPGIFAVKNRDSGDIHVTMVDEPPIGLNEIKARVIRVEAAAARGELPDCDPVTYLCDFFYLHDQKELLPEAAQDVVVDALAQSYDDARARAKAAESMQKEARARLVEALGERSKVRTVQWSVSRSLQKRTKVDLDKARADGVDLVPYETVTETETVRVSAVGGGVGE